jgi:hypothetical protein
MEPPDYSLETFPFRHANASFSKNLSQKIPANVLPVWVWNAYPQILLNHKLVLTARVWAKKVKLSQVLNQLSASDGTE